MTSKLYDTICTEFNLLRPLISMLNEGIMPKYIIKKYLEDVIVKFPFIVKVPISEEWTQPIFCPFRFIRRMDVSQYTTFFRPTSAFYPVLKFILSRGLIDVNTGFDIYRTPLLHFAVICDDIKLVKLLLYYGADMELENEQKISVFCPHIIKSREMRKLIYEYPLAHGLYCFKKLNEKKWLYDKQISVLFQRYLI